MGGRVLLVDDDQSIFTFVEEALEMYGYEVRTVVSAQGALKKIAEDPPEVIVLDVMLPGMDGYQLKDRLRQDPTTAHIPILMITAHMSRAPGPEKLKELGVDGFLLKPFALDTLRSELERLLKKSRR